MRYPDVVLRKKASQSNSSPIHRPRPVSERLVPTLDFETKSFLKQTDSQTSDIKLCSSATRHEINESKTTDERERFTNMSGMDCVSTLENKPTTTTADSRLFSSFPHVKLPGFKRTHVLYTAHAQSDTPSICQSSSSTSSTDAPEIKSTNNASSDLKLHAPNANKKTEKTTIKSFENNCSSVCSKHLQNSLVKNDSREDSTEERTSNKENSTDLNASDSDERSSVIDTGFSVCSKHLQNNLVKNDSREDSAEERKSNKENSTDLNASDSDERSSVIDTGFSSFGDVENSPLSNNTSDLSFNHQYKNQVPDSKKSIRAFDIPTTLRSCYLNQCQINSDVEKCSSLTSRSSAMSLSEILSEDDNVTETISANSNQNSSSLNDNYLLGDNQESNTADARKSRFIAKAPLCATLNSDASPNSEHLLKVQTQSIEISSVRAWKDDESLVLSSSLAVDENTPRPTHGTWPRRLHCSKRKQNQVEADELLRRFRETTDTYRERFRHIYDESRRKIEEAMFGLRVALAKNGYTSRYHDLQGSTQIDNSGTT